MSSMERFEEIRELGLGSYGRAILVRQRGDSHLLVIKQMRLPYLMSAQKKSSDDVPYDQAKVVELAYQEVNLLTSLRHPNIVKAFEAFEDQSNNLNLVMEYCECGDLNQAIFEQNGKIFAESQIRAWFSQLVFAVKYLHDRKILHRDVKAANIFLVNERRVIKLGDLGIAKVLDRTGGMAMTQIGTPTYIAPELCDGLAYGEKAEVWSLGVVLYQLSGLILPFVENNLPALFMAIKTKSPPTLPGHFSSQLTSLVDKMLAKEPEDRPSVAQLVTDEFLLSSIADLVARACSVGSEAEPKPLNNAESMMSSSSGFSGASASETVSLRGDEPAPASMGDNELAEKIRKSVEPVFREPMLAIFRDQLLTEKTVISLSDVELKELCSNKKGLQLALVRFVEDLREEDRLESSRSLKAAIEDSDCGSIRKIAKSFADGDQKVGDIVVDSETGNTALHLACKLGQTDPLKLLLSLGADVGSRNRFEDQPLHVACFAGRLLAVDILLRNKAQVNTIGQLGRSALHMAAASGYSNVVAMLLQHGAVVDVTSAPEDLQQTPLLVGCFFGHVGVVRVLLEKAGAQLTAANSHGDSALHIATVQNKLDVAKLLLDKAGAGIAELLEWHGFRGRTPLHAAAAWGRPDIARLLLSKGASVRAPSGSAQECCDTPLHLAAFYGHSEVAKLIIDADPAALELRNSNGETPLSRACFAGQLAVSRLLLNRGASTSVRDKNNQTPFFYAKRKADQVATARGDADAGQVVSGIENPAAVIVQLLVQNRQNMLE